MGCGIALEVIVVVAQSGLGRFVATAIASALIVSAVGLWGVYLIYRRRERVHR